MLRQKRTTELLNDLQMVRSYWTLFCHTHTWSSLHSCQCRHLLYSHSWLQYPRFDKVIVGQPQRSQRSKTCATTFLFNEPADYAFFLDSFSVSMIRKVLTRVSSCGYRWLEIVRWLRFITNLLCVLPCSFVVGSRMYLLMYMRKMLI